MLIKKILLKVILTVVIGFGLARATLFMAKAAAHAFQHDQMSYSKFTKELTSGR